MPVLTFIDKAKIDITVPKAYLKGKRRLTPAEISVLTDNLKTRNGKTYTLMMTVLVLTLLS